MTIASFLILAASVNAPAPPEPVRKAVADLQGRWEATGIEENGERGTLDERLILTVKGNDMFFRRGTDDSVQFPFVVDPSKSPAHLDLTAEKGEKNTCRAIYRIDDKGELTICLGSNFSPCEPDRRPTEFATLTGDEKRPPKGRILFTFKRAK